jgi:hypothetical protein
MNDQAEKRDDNSVIAALKAELRVLKTAILTAVKNAHSASRNNTSQIVDWRFTKQNYSNITVPLLTLDW